MAPLPPPFTLRQLAYLVAAAEAGTVVGAAARMHVSPSTMSDAISELERLMGTRLCVRRKAQGLVLTSAGLRAVADARLLLRGAQELYSALNADEDELVGPLAVGCFPTLAPTILPPLLTDFAASHPRVEIEVVEGTQDRLVEMIESGRLDIAFVYDAFIPGRSRRERLYELPPHILLARSHRLANEPFVQLEDLEDETFIMLDAPPSTEHALSTFTSRGIAPRIGHRTGNVDVIRTLVGQGLGYGLLIQRLPDHGAASGLPVVMKEIRPEVPAIPVEVIWAADVEPTRRAAAAIDFVRAVTWPSAPAVA